MYIVNRSAVVLKAKQAFVDWLNALPETEPVTHDELAHESIIILLPEFDDPEREQDYLRKIAPTILDSQMESWCMDDSHFPRKKDWALLQKWFEIELISEVFDVDEDPLEKEEM